MGAVFAEPPVLCGHRGMGAGSVRGHAENTIGSLLAAAAAGVPWVEIDARRTADDQLVAQHDPVLADGRPVAHVAAAETGLPLLRELLEPLPPGVGVNVEIKTALEDALCPPERTTAALAVAALADESERRAVLLSSFDPAALVIMRARADVPVGLITWMRFPLRKAVPAAVHLGAAVLVAHVSSFGLGRDPAPLHEPARRHVEVAHGAGLQVAAWGGGNSAELVELGVDCLIVDEPGGT